MWELQYTLLCKKLNMNKKHKWWILQGCKLRYVYQRSAEQLTACQNWSCIPLNKWNNGKKGGLSTYVWDSRTVFMDWLKSSVNSRHTVMPNLRFKSWACLTLEPKTWRRVWISSSVWKIQIKWDLAILLSAVYLYVLTLPGGVYTPLHGVGWVLPEIWTP